MATQPSYRLTHRRDTIPPELEDPEDCTIGEAEGDYFEPTGGLDEDRVKEQHGELSPGDEQMEIIRNRFLQLPKEIRNIVAGGIAGMCAKAVVAPLDRVKILFQVSSATFRLMDLPRVVNNIIHNEGFSALWKGNAATMLRVVPYSGIQFMVFERLKVFFLKEHERGRYYGNPEQRRKFGLTATESLMAGMTAGGVSVICTYPLDLARVQLAVLKKHKGPLAKQKHYGFAQVFADNYNIHGVRGLFRGLSPTLLGMLPYAGLAFTINEQTKREIQHITGRDLKTMERIQCGALAGLVAQTLTYPAEVVRRRMQTIGFLNNQDSALGNLGESAVKSTSANAAENVRPLSLVHTIRSLYHEQGVRGFFKGVTMNWMKGPVAFAISFTVFDTVQGLLESESERARRIPSRFH